MINWGSCRNISLEICKYVFTLIVLLPYFILFSNLRKYFNSEKHLQAVVLCM